MVKALAHLRRCHSDMTVQQAMILLHIAENPGVTQRALYEALDANDSVAARTLAVLSNIGMRGVRGLNLVELTINPEDRRERLLTLTPGGRRVIDEIVSDLTGHSPKR
jgi:DNA-binding MarR family transcriptional regulator